MTCPHCGAETAPGQSFCTKCGSSLQAAASQSGYMMPQNNYVDEYEDECEDDGPGFVQPIWNTTSNRRIASIIAWVAAVFITIGMFTTYGKIGNVLTDIVGKGVDMLSGTNTGSTIAGALSFNLFGAFGDMLVVKILMIIALVLLFVFPLFTMTPLNLIPGAFLLGVNIYSCINAKAIILAGTVDATADLTAQTQEAGNAVSQALDMLPVGIIHAGSVCSWLGLVLLLVAVVLHFVLKPKQAAAASVDYCAPTPQPAADPYASGQPLPAPMNDAYADTDVLNRAPVNPSPVQMGSNLCLPTEMLNESSLPTAYEGMPVGYALPPLAGSITRLNTGEVYDLRTGEMVVGKEVGRADMVIANEAISRLHAKIVVTNGVCGIVDLNSTNGTFLNDKRLVPNIKVNLNDGDYIQLADEILQFHKG